MGILHHWAWSSRGLLGLDLEAQKLPLSARGLYASKSESLLLIIGSQRLSLYSCHGHPLLALHMTSKPAAIPRTTTLAIQGFVDESISIRIPLSIDPPEAYCPILLHVADHLMNSFDEL